MLCCFHWINIWRLQNPKLRSLKNEIFNYFVNFEILFCIDIVQNTLEYSTLIVKQWCYFDKIRENGYAAGPRLIFVGSLEDNSNNLASYSYYAGDLKEDFLVAHDDILSSGDAAGTSFAAPRVAGAAAIVKQKFPNLTSSQIKQVLLQTADDLGDVGVDRIYGYGKLNIANSLSPQGRVIPKWL